MDLTKIAIALGAFLLLSGAVMIGMVMWAESGNQPLPSASDQPDAALDQRAQLEKQVLEGYEVSYMGGRPMIRYYDEAGGGYVTDEAGQALFWMAQRAGGGYSDVGYTTNPTDPEGAKAAYRLGMVHEHGLLGRSPNRSEALRYYRMANVAGHKDAPAALKRLES